jgi:fatty acid desaturase
VGIPPDVAGLVAARGMTRPSGRRSAGRTAVAVGLYAGAGLLAAWVGHPLGRAAAWAFQGLLLVGSYSAMHEAAHGHLYRGRRANRASGVLFAAAVLVDFSLYRAYHLHHHVETRTPDDPEPRVHFDGLGHYLVGLPLAGVAFVAGLALAAARNVAGHPPPYVRTAAQRRAVTVDAAVLAGLLAALALVVPAGELVRWWLAPLAVAYVAFFPLTALPEHHGCDDDADPLANTRTVLSNRVFRFLYWNNNFHAEHHLCPSVAYHRAPELHAHLAGRHRHLSRSYLAYQREVVRDLRSSKRRQPAR